MGPAPRSDPGPGRAEAEPVVSATLERCAAANGTDRSCQLPAGRVSSGAGSAAA
jgi:hypothetical protein